MRWLKSLVIFLAILIAAAVAMLGYGFYKRTGDPDWRLFSVTKTPPETTSAAAAPTPSAVPAASVTVPAKKPATVWGDLALGLPAGCRITGVTPDSGRLYLSIGPDGPCHRVMVIDTDTGRVLGTVRPGP